MNSSDFDFDRDRLHYQAWSARIRQLKAELRQSTRAATVVSPSIDASPQRRVLPVRQRVVQAGSAPNGSAAELND